LSGSATTISARQARALSSDRPAFLQAVPLGAQAFDLGQHPSKQELSRRCRDAGTLKLQDLPTPSSDLDAHVFDFGTNVI
jgi:hypothetical protein